MSLISLKHYLTGSTGGKLFICPALLVCLFLCAPTQARAMGRAINPSQNELKALREAKGRIPGEILFSSRRSGEWAIYRIYADGTNLVRLSPPKVHERTPIFILEGQKVVFDSNRNGLTQVWMADPDLSHAAPLSPPNVQEWLQGVSKDGRWLLIRRERTPQGYWLRDLHQKRDVKVDFSGLKAKRGKTDVWLAPDGRRLYFAFWPSGGGQLGRTVVLAEIGRDGKVGPGRKVSDGCGLGWRSDSNAVLTVRTVHGGSDIWEVNWDGGRRRLTTAKNWDYFPAYGPQDQWLAWSAAPLDQHDHNTGNYELFIRPLNGGAPLRLTFHSAPDNEPAWRAQRGPLLRRSDDQRLFEAEDYAHKPASVKNYEGASGGKAAFLPITDAKTAMVYGQYSSLPTGRHLAEFKLRAAKQAEGSLELDLAAMGGKYTLASKVIPVSDLETDAWKSIELDFETEKPLNGLEARVALMPGSGGVWLDYIAIRPEPESLAAYLKRLAYAAFVAWWWD